MRNAKVSFYLRNKDGSLTPIAGASNLPVGLVNGTVLTVGTATVNVSLPLGTYNLVTVVTNYTRSSTMDDAVLVVAQPLDNFITGGGTLVNQSSNGFLAGRPGEKTNFGFNVKYNKGGTNLQGNANIIVRSNWELDPASGQMVKGTVEHVYQLKSAAISTLSVNPSTGKAVFSSKVNVKDITNPLQAVSVDGGATLQLATTDGGDPTTPGQAAPDMLSVTVWNKNGGLWFSSNWSGTQTVEQSLTGGNLRVH